MTKRPSLSQQLAAAKAESADWRKRAEAAEAAEAGLGPVAGVERRQSLFARIKPLFAWLAWFKHLDTWEKLIFAVLVFGAIGLLAVVAEVTLAYLVGKAKHAIAVIAYGVTGAFIGLMIAWAVNCVPSIRERAVPAADDSMKGITAWRELREAGSPWTVQDAITTLAACLRFGMSYLGVVVLAAVGMMMAK